MSVLFERQGHVAVITINRPEKLNAINREVNQGLQEAWRTLKSNKELRVAVLTGAGTRAFSVGRDVKEYGESLESLDWIEDPGLDDLETDETMRKPTICAVEGYCLGRAFTIALSCDLRVASESALFQYPEVKWGLMTHIGGVKLPRLIPRAIALEIVMTGDPVSAAEAYRIGLVNRLVPNGTALKAALELANRIAANPPLGVQASREVVYRSAHMSPRDGWRLGEGLRAAIRRAPEVREAMMASLQKKRPPEEKQG